MFRGRRAWFSQSVSPGPRELWVAGGGVVTHWRDADYLFSSDAAHPDTRRFTFGNQLSFSLAEYMRALITWRAELQSFTPVTSLRGRAPMWERSCLWFWATLSCHLPACKKPNEKLTDEPEAVRKSCEEEAEEDVLDLAESSEEETGSRAPAQGEFPYRTLQEYPTNNMVTGYTSARDMKKYVGELCDFIPGSSGYAVYWIQNEINIYSDVKTKTKRRFK
ncbi:telomere repeats-binding bouquet formation protein 2 isoform X7 [Aquila chrysaetos chrysaetos]|uniref:telomere repeats-binding bouquet formation protein 2 isoform X7 n=1 Tax=Aquila chrysaetos chrysaetos TaxID=223781 RepID=UPI001B7D2E3D|nr:telomere repeats-binding bouquet formation protein 2 isoform X7 [Aquila chrysaetos chrysaetos]